MLSRITESFLANIFHPPYRIRMPEKERLRFEKEIELSGLGIRKLLLRVKAAVARGSLFAAEHPRVPIAATKSKSFAAPVPAAHEKI